MFLSKYRSLEQRTASRVSPDCTYHEYGKPLCLRAVHFRGTLRLWPNFVFFSSSTFLEQLFALRRWDFVFPHFCPSPRKFLLGSAIARKFACCRISRRPSALFQQSRRVFHSPKISHNLNVFSQAYSFCPSIRLGFYPEKGITEKPLGVTTLCELFLTESLKPTNHCFPLFCFSSKGPNTESLPAPPERRRMDFAEKGEKERESPFLSTPNFHSSISDLPSFHSLTHSGRN